MWKRLSLIRQWRRRFGTEIIATIEGASQMGCRVIEMHPTLTATGATRKHSKNPKTHPNLNVPLPGFWLSGWGLCCRWLLQSVANCCKLLQESGSRLKLLQTVAICCNLLQNQKPADSASRCVPPVALVDEGANQNRWT